MSDSQVASTPKETQPEQIAVVKKMKFRRKLREIPFDFEELDGNVREYKLRECPLPDLTEWQSQAANRTRTPLGGLADHEGFQTSLLGKMIFDPVGTPVGRKVLDTWPSSVIQVLFAEAYDLNGLSEKGQELTKKG